MNTRFGGRQRPALKILRWIAFGPEGTALPPTSPSLLPSSQPEYPAEAAAAPDQAKTKAKTAKVKDKAKDAGASVVSDLSLHEELDDDIPF
jgi:nucleoid-associated protein YgaU